MRSRYCTNRLFSSATQPPPLPKTLPLGVCFDIDGVLLRGSVPLPRARESLLRLSEARVPFVFLTNGGGEEEYKKAEKLSTLLDMEINTEQVILSHTPLRDVVKSYADKRILILGCRDVMAVARSYGALKPVDIPALAADDPTRYPFIRSEHRPAANRDEPIEACFMIHDPANWGVEIQITLDVLRGGNPLGSGVKQNIPFFASNPDLLFAGSYPVPRLAAGAYLAALSTLWREVMGSELNITQYGKPSAATFTFARQQLSRWASRAAPTPSASIQFGSIFHIGDNPRADVRGANAAGAPWRSVLVRSGVFTGAINDVVDPAQYVVEGVGEAIDLALRSVGP